MSTKIAHSIDALVEAVEELMDQREAAQKAAATLAPSTEPQRGTPAPVAEEAAVATTAAPAPEPATTAEQPTIFGPGPADPPDPPLPAGVLPDHGWVKGLTQGIEEEPALPEEEPDGEQMPAVEQPDDQHPPAEASAEAAPVQPDGGTEAPAIQATPAPDAQPQPQTQPGSVNVTVQLPAPAPIQVQVPIPAPQLPQPPMMPAPALAQWQPPAGSTPPPLGMAYQAPEPRQVVVRDPVAAAAIRYNVAVKALNGSVPAAKLLEPAAQRRGLGWKELAHMIVQEQIAIEQRVLAEF